MFPIIARSCRASINSLPGISCAEHGREPGPPQQWWDISFEARKGSTQDLSAQLLHLMREGVTSRMVADVPLGAFSRAASTVPRLLR